MNSDVKPNDASIPSSDALSGAMEKLLAHPELISMVASALKGQDSAPSPQASEEKKGGDGNEAFPTSVGNIGNRESSDVLSSLMPMLSKLGSMSSNSATSAPHAALLCALKPYVSPTRREAIDYFMKFSQMSALISGLK